MSDVVSCGIRDCPAVACILVHAARSRSEGVALCNYHWRFFGAPSWRSVRLHLPRAQAGVAGDDFDIPRGLGW